MTRWLPGEIHFLFPKGLNLEVLLLAVWVVGFVVLIGLGGLDPNSCAVGVVGFVVLIGLGGLNPNSCTAIRKISEGKNLEEEAVVSIISITIAIMIIFFHKENAQFRVFMNIARINHIVVLCK